MKVNLKNTRIIILITILHIAILSWNIAQTFIGFTSPDWLFYPKAFVFYGSYFVVLIYLRNVAIFLADSRQIRVVFIAYLLILLLPLILRLIIRSQMPNLTFYVPIGILNFLITLYLAILFIKIRNQYFKPLWLILGITLIILPLWRVTFPFIIASIFGNITLFRYIVLPDLLPVVAILFIFIRLVTFLENEKLKAMVVETESQ